jgi:hypothetical protein
MTQVQEIEEAIRALPDTEMKSLVLRINDLYWDAWDGQMQQDWESGKLDRLIADAEKEIEAGKIKALDGVLHDL